MKRACLVLLLAVSCAPTQSEGDGGDDYGLPPAGDAGRTASLGEWDALRVSDPEGYQQLLGYALAYSGQSADLTGDGEPDLLVRREPDGTIVRSYLSSDSAYHPNWVATFFPDGRETLAIDLDNNTVFDVTTEFDPQTRTRVELTDVRFSGKPQSRRTVTLSEDEARETVVVEEDPTGAGVWTETARWTGDRALENGVCTAADGPNPGLKNFPVYNFLNRPSKTSAADSTLPNVLIVEQDAIACDPVHVTAVQAAFSCALKRLACLDRSSKDVASRVRSALSSRRLYVGCNNPCDNANATTIAPANFLGSGRMNLHDDLTSDPSLMCRTVLHELMHFAEVPHDEHHEDGVDRIYACGRYCHDCDKDSIAGAAVPTNNEDCARCGETAYERMKCGIKSTLEAADCNGLDLCHAGLSGNSLCETCKGFAERDCNGEALRSEAAWACCETCPAAYPTNDEPCTGKMGTDTCSMKTPECP